MAEQLIRFTGDVPLYEPQSAGRRSRWWPGELRSVDPTVALALLLANQGWEIESPSGAPVLLTSAQVAAVAPLMLDASATSGAIANNTSRILDRLALGGDILMGTANGGAFGVNQSLILYNRSRVRQIPGSRLVMAAGVSAPIYVNEHWQSAAVTVTNGITDYPSGRYTFSVSGVTVSPTKDATYTNNGVTYYVLQVSISGGAGTVVCQAAGAPQASGTLTKSGGTGDATFAFSAAATTLPALAGTRLAVADCGSNAHGLSALNGVRIGGDNTSYAANRSLGYFGVKEVAEVLSATMFSFWVPEKIALGSTTGTMTASRANLGIVIEGGDLDYNGAYNQANYDYRAHAIVLNNVGRSTVRDMGILNAPKYGLYGVNTDGLLVSNLHFENASDGVHLHGMCLDATVQRLRGATADDFFAYTPDNTGYTQYDIPGTTMTGPCIGLTVRDLKPYRCGEDIVALYATSDNILDDAIVDDIGAPTGKCNRLAVLSPPSASSVAATAVGTVRFRNFFGLPRAQGLRIGQYSIGITIGTLDISGIYPGATVDLATGYIHCTGATVNKLIVEPRSRMVMDIAAARYLIQADATTVLGRVTVRDYEASTTGAGGSHVVIAGSTTSVGEVEFDNVRLAGTAHLAAALAGTPDISVVNSHFDGYSALRVNFSAKLRVNNNRFRAPGAAVPILCYGSGVTIDLQASGNDFGNATNWLQIGTAAGDTLVFNLWQSGNKADPASSTPGITFTSTSGTLRLRASDGWAQHDASKWGGINNGAIYYNTNAAYGTGIGLYSQAPGGATRVQTQISGTAVLVAGTVTVNNAAVTAAAGIRLSLNTAGGTLGALFVSAKSVGASFAISSSSALDTSTVNWTMDV